MTSAQRTDHGQIAQRTDPAVPTSSQCNGHTQCCWLVTSDLTTQPPTVNHETYLRRERAQSGLSLPTAGTALSAGTARIEQWIKSARSRLVRIRRRSLEEAGLDLAGAAQGEVSAPRPESR